MQLPLGLKFPADEEALIKLIRTVSLPEWQCKLNKRNADAIQVHSQGQLFCKINTLFPNEHPASKQHRIMAFESITEASFGRAANNVNRIFKNSSYTVEASENTLQYLAEENFQGQNFYDWFLDQWVSYALKEDPNSRIVIYPPDYFNETGKQMCFVGSEFIRWIDNETFIFISEEESDMKYELEEVILRDVGFYDQSINGPNYRQVAENTFTPKFTAKVTRYVYHVFQKGQGFYKIEQLLQNSKEWEVSFYPIEQDYLPVIDAGGEKNKRGINKSFLHPFVNFGNLALLQHSQHTAVNFTFSFPRMSEIETPCPAIDCKNGSVDTEDPAYPDGVRACKVCGGSGYTSNQSPYKIYKKRFDPNGMEGTEKYLEIPDVQYYTPDVSILDYSKNEWRQYLEMAETAIYIQQKIKTGNVEAAKSKEIDRDDLYAFLSKVGKTFFARMKFSIQAFENYFNARPNKVVVNTPYSYAILSEGEAFDALKTILESNIPVPLKANQVESFINKFVSQGSPLRKFIDVLKMVDLLFYYNANELTAMKIGGAITPEQYTTHVFAYPVLQRMYVNDKNLFQQDINVITGKLTTELEGFKPEPVPDLKTALINNNG